MTSILPELAPDLMAVLERHADRLDVDLIDRALRFSASAHRGQKRMSGEDFISHSIAVALILAEQLLDTATIAAALLHDVVEDSDVRTEDIAREFGAEIAGIVDGLTKISSSPSAPPRRSRSRTTASCCCDREGCAGHHHQAGRPAAQHAHAGAPPARPAAPDRDGDPRDLRAAGPPLRHGRHQGRAGGPGLQVPGGRRVSRPGEPSGGQAGGSGADHSQAQDPARP